MKRDRSFDALRGIAIICVIAIHAANSGFKWYAEAEGEWNFYYTLIVKQFYVCAVPLFFFMAGYFAIGKQSLIVSNKLAFVYTKLKRILIPYLFWSLLIIFVLHRRFDLLYILKHLLFGQALGPYYFLIALSCLIILTPVFFIAGFNRRNLFIVAAINVISLIFIYYLRITSETGLPWQYAALPFTSWIFFYYLGLFLAAHKRKILFSRFESLNLSIVFLVISFLSSQIETFYLLEHFGVDAGGKSAIKFSSFLYSLSVINLFLIIRKFDFTYNKYLLLIGEYSFGIYLIHELFRLKLSMLLSHVALLNAVQPLLQILVIVFTLMISVTIIRLSKIMLGEKIALKYLGF